MMRAQVRAVGAVLALSSVATAGYAGAYKWVPGSVWEGACKQGYEVGAVACWWDGTAKTCDLGYQPFGRAANGFKCEPVPQRKPPQLSGNARTPTKQVVAPPASLTKTQQLQEAVGEASLWSEEVEMGGMLVLTALAVLHLVFIVLSWFTGPPKLEPLTDEATYPPYKGADKDGSGKGTGCKGKKGNRSKTDATFSMITDPTRSEAPPPSAPQLRQDGVGMANRATERGVAAGDHPPVAVSAVPAVPVLVTGGSGILGHSTIARLVQVGGYTVVAVDSTPPPAARRVSGVTYIKLDVASAGEEALAAVFQDALAVIHAADVCTAQQDSRSCVLLHNMHVVATRKVVRHARLAGCRALVLASSTARPFPFLLSLFLLLLLRPLPLPLPLLLLLLLVLLLHVLIFFFFFFLFFLIGLVSLSRHLSVWHNGWYWIVKHPSLTRSAIQTPCTPCNWWV
jgi:hypothetical protein